MNPTQLLEEALKVKETIDGLILADKLYICLDCKQVNTYWTTCQACETYAETHE